MQALYQSERYRLERYFTRRGWGGEADDLTQEAFLRLWRCYRPGPATPRTVLYVIAANLATDRGRKRALQRAREEQLRRVPAPASDPALIVADKDALRCLVTACKALPEAQRHALACMALLGFSDAETGRVLGIPRGAVKARLHRARATLRERLKEAS